MSTMNDKQHVAVRALIFGKSREQFLAMLHFFTASVLEEYDKAFTWALAYRDSVCNDHGSTFE
jgi:hypothetical protein